MGNIQISQELFIALLQYFLADREDLFPDIQKQLEKKLDASVRRKLYTRYKTAPTEEEREKARQQYLDQRGVPDSFRW